MEAVSDSISSWPVNDGRDQRSSQSIGEGSAELTRKEDEDIAWRALQMDLEDGLECSLLVVCLCLLGVENVDVELAPLDVDDGSPTSAEGSVADRWNAETDHSRIEEVAEALGVDGSTHHHNLERRRIPRVRSLLLALALDFLLPQLKLLPPPLLNILEESHEHIGPQTPLVSLVQHNDIVSLEISVGEHLGEEGSIGGELQASTLATLVVETNSVSDERSYTATDLGGYTGGEGEGGDSTRLGNNDARSLARGGRAHECLWDFCGGGQCSQLGWGQ